MSIHIKEGIKKLYMIAHVVLNFKLFFLMHKNVSGYEIILMIIQVIKLITVYGLKLEVPYPNPNHK